MAGEKIKKNLERSNPAVMPMGFRTGISSDIMLVDLLDIPNQNDPRIIYTIALTKASAQNLAESIAEFLAKAE